MRREGQSVSLGSGTRKLRSGSKTSAGCTNFHQRPSLDKSFCGRFFIFSLGFFKLIFVTVIGASSWKREGSISMKYMRYLSITDIDVSSIWRSFPPRVS